MADAPPGLLKLPNALLRKIAALLGPAGLGRLSQANHRLLDFALDYSRPHVNRLAALSNNLVLEVIAHLRDNDRSRLARTSYRFYPLVMDAVLCQEVRIQNGKLMEFAFMEGRKGLARGLLERGDNVEARSIHETYGLSWNTLLSVHYSERWAVTPERMGMAMLDMRMSKMKLYLWTLLVSTQNATYSNVYQIMCMP
jgi:hypothetical protein